MTNGYDFYFKDGSDVLIFPITPGELTIKVGSNNKVVTLIDGGDINILKSPSLVEVEFEARFPMRKYPYSREVSNFQTYHDKFKELKEKRKSFRFIVVRNGLTGGKGWETNLLMALEDYTLKESADEGDDVLITFKLKQFKEYGVKIITTTATTSTSPTTRPNDGKDDSSAYYIVKKGDCLWNIAKKFYGNGAKWTIIYNANKSAIEEDAKKHGRKSSSNGHWIYPGLKLLIPNVNSTGSNSSSSGSSSSSSGGSTGTVNGSKATKSTNTAQDSGRKYSVTVYQRNWKKGRGKVQLMIHGVNGGTTTYNLDGGMTSWTVNVPVNSYAVVKVSPSHVTYFDKIITSGNWTKSNTYHYRCKVTKNSNLYVFWK